MLRNCWKVNKESQFTTMTIHFFQYHFLAKKPSKMAKFMQLHNFLFRDFLSKKYFVFPLQTQSDSSHSIRPLGAPYVLDRLVLM